MSRSIGTLSEELAWVRNSTPWATSRSPIGGSPTRPLTISSRRSSASAYRVGSITRHPRIKESARGRLHPCAGKISLSIDSSIQRHSKSNKSRVGTGGHAMRLRPSHCSRRQAGLSGAIGDAHRGWLLRSGDDPSVVAGRHGGSGQDKPESRSPRKRSYRFMPCRRARRSTTSCSRSAWTATSKRP